MLILKKINNNVALAASDDGREVVVFGKGIGFHEMPYELVDESLIQRKFYNVPESLQDMVGTLPDDVLLAASDIACFASQQLGCKLSGGLPFILADHLQFAVQRDDDQISAPNPLEHEVAFIYPRELEIGQAALAIVQKHTGAKLGQNEATSIALHIVNAEVDGMGRAKDMDFIMKSTRVLDEVTHSVEKQLGCSLDTASYCYIRFLAHLRFLVRRLVKGSCTQTENSSYDPIHCQGPQWPRRPLAIGRRGLPLNPSRSAPGMSSTPSAQSHIRGYRSGGPQSSPSAGFP